MAGLGDTTAFLKQMRRYAEDAGGMMSSTGRCREIADFGANPGQLRMLAYVPEGLPPGSPLVVTLHGCTQFGEAYAASAGWLDLADHYGFAVLAPEQTQGNNPSRCFNWFSAEDTRRGSGEVASIAAMIRRLTVLHGLDAERVYVTGLSAGGAMTAAMLASYPELFAGGAIIAGLPYGSANSLPEAMKAMQNGDGRSAEALAAQVRQAAPDAKRPLKLTIWHGDDDHTVHPANGRDLAKQWTTAAGLREAGAVVGHNGFSRQTWEGASVVELVTVPGLGHGAPLATSGADGLGSAAPFMIEVGISSTREIAAFWGLTKNPAYQQRPKPKAQPDFAPNAAHGLSGKVQDVINKALKSAGLMK